MTALPEGDRAAEARLVERARTDAEAFGLLYDRYVGRVYRYAHGRTGSHPHAEDLTAQTFYQALERLDSYQDRGLPFGAWLFRIAHNAVLDHARQLRPALPLDDVQSGPLEPTSMDPLPEDALLRGEQLDRVWQAVAGLPLMQRRAVTLYFARGLSHVEVGQVIGRSEPATKQLVYRAVKTLRRQLAGGEGERDE